MTLTTHDAGAVSRAAHLETDPSFWPEEIRRTGAHFAKAKEALTLLKRLEKPTMIRVRMNLMEANAELSKTDATELVFLSKEYREYSHQMAEAEKNKSLWESRYAAAKAQHEAARTYESTRRAALYRAG